MNRYRLIIYNNKVLFYDSKNNIVSVINNHNNGCKDNKINDIDSFIKNIKSSNVIKKINNRLIGNKLEIIIWPNYSELDKRVLIDILNDMNFTFIEFKLLSELLNLKIPNIIVSVDGIYYIYDSIFYYNCISHDDSIIDLINYLKKRYNISKYIMIGNIDGILLLDEDSYVYENNESFFEDMLKNMD